MTASESRGARRPLRKRWWVRLIVLPLAILVAAHAGWMLLLMWRFDGRLSDLRAAGAPVSLADLVPAPIPEEENAAPLLGTADRWYEEHLLPDESVLTRYIWDTYDDLGWEIDAERLAQKEKETAALKEWLARGDPYVELLARAAAKPKLQQALDWGAGFAIVVPTGPQMARASEFIHMRVRLAETQTLESIRELAVLLDLAPKLERQWVIQVLARWALENGVADALKVLARKPGFDAEATRHVLDERLAVTDDVSVLSEALRCERATGLSFTCRWLSGENPLRIVANVDALSHRETGDGRKQPGGWMYSDAVLSSWVGRPLAYRDGLRFLDLMARALALLERSPREAYAAAEGLEEEYRTGFPNICSHLFAVIPRAAMKERLRHLATMRIARVGLALLELKQKAGAWPQSLADVVPLVGPDTVIDPFTGERLHYKAGARVEAALPIPEQYRALSQDELSAMGYEVAWRFGRR